MGIKRWTVEADATITNAYKEALNERGSLGNMGAADSLEVFSLHGQVSATGAASKEAARIVIRPDLLSIRTAIAVGEVPKPNASNAPKYYLRLFNAVHPETLPANFSLTVHQLAEAFTEGSGVDMSTYSDAGSVNWTNRIDTATGTATGTITVATSPTNGTTFTVKIDDETTTVTAAASATLTRDAIVAALGSSGKVTVANSGSVALTITSKVAGTVGNYTYAIANTTGNITTANHYMTGGNDYTPWGTPNNSLDDTGPFSGTMGTVAFTSGQEDLILDITSYVVAAIWDGSALRDEATSTANNKGVMVKVQAESTAKSYYTKKFFARSSEFFFKRPNLEARWNGAIKDDRAKLNAKKSYVAVNTQNVYLYNLVDGVLTDLTFTAGQEIYFSLYKESTFATVVPLDGPVNFVEATKISTGVYRAQFAVDTTETSLYERWYLSTDGTASIIDVQSSEITVNQPKPVLTIKSKEYVFSITNLKPSYTKTEKPRFRLYSRLKDWSPTIYTVASKAIENEIVDNVYYQIFRATDDEVVIDYGIGTANNNSNHTLLSYDKDGNYFDFDMSMLETGYMYGIKFATYVNGEILEYKKAFKFRID